MYTEFYDLKKKPFDLSPSSRFLYLGETHKEALALLTYGLREKQGFGLLTGEVGTGKTTIIHALLADLDQNVHLVHLSNPLLSPREFLDFLARKTLGRQTPFLSKAEFLIDFEMFLTDCLKSGKNFLLIIDEAHKVSFELLEEIRLLSNMETAEEKLMGIFLVGQPELRERLKDPKCRALFQRITTHYHLSPLDQDSTGEYIRTRLRAAGAKTPDKIFRESVIKKIHQYSKGYPRRINNLSDNLLLLSYAQGKQKITPEMVTQCYRDMNIEIPPLEEEEMPRPDEQREAPPPPLPARWKRLSFTMGFVATLALILVIGFVRTGMFSRSVGVNPQAGKEQREIREEIREEVQQKGDEETTGEPSSSRLEGLVPVEEVGTVQGVPLQDPLYPPFTEYTAIHNEAEKGNPGPPPPVDLESPPGRTSLQTLTILEGQTLRELALEAYGEADEDVLTMLQEANPVIEDINMIEVGQQITFPPLSMEGRASDDQVASALKEQREIREEIREEVQQEGDKETTGEPSSSRLEGLVPEEEAGMAQGVPLQEPLDPPSTEYTVIHNEADKGKPGPPPPVGLESPPGPTSLQTLTVLEGQTLVELAVEAYGEADEAVLTMLQEANPVIEDINVIEVGQQITFPPLSMEGRASDDQVARHVPSSTETEHRRETPDRDAYDRIDQDILRTLKKEHPGAYLDFWEGLLHSDNGRKPTDPENSGPNEDARKRISHFVQAVSGIESETGSLRGTTGTLHPAALRAYDELSSFDPSSYAPLLNDSVTSRETWQGDIDLIHALNGPDEARQEEERTRLLLVIHHPDTRPRELHTLGLYALEAGWPQGAIAAFDRIVEDRTPDYEAYNNRAVAYLRTGEMERARNDLNRAIEKDPARPEAFNNMGVTYVHDKAYEDAATYFLHAAKVEPSFHVSLLNAAVVCGERLENGDRATRLAREYLDRGGIFQRQMLVEWLGEP